MILHGPASGVRRHGVRWCHDVRACPAVRRHSVCYRQPASDPRRSDSSGDPAAFLSGRRPGGGGIFSRPRCGGLLPLSLPNFYENFLKEIFTLLLLRNRDTFFGMYDPAINGYDPMLIDSDRVKTKRWLSESDRVVDICEWLASGGSLIELCKMLDVQYSSVLRWINIDGERRRAYEMALKDRDEFVKQELIDELRKICKVDIRRAFDEGGNLLSIKEMPEDVAKAVSAFDIDEDALGNERVRVRFLDKLKAIETMGKNLKMFVDRVEHSGTVTLEDMVVGSLAPPVVGVTPAEIKALTDDA